jgi:hypothetical protein
MFFCILNRASRCSDDSSGSKSHDLAYSQPAYTFEILGGIGLKSYMPCVSFLLHDHARAPASPATRMCVDMLSSVLTLRPDLVPSAAQAAASAGCCSALELCGTMQQQEVPPCHTRNASLPDPLLMPDLSLTRCR